MEIWDLAGPRATSAQKIVSSGRRSKSPEFVLKFRGCARSVEVGRGRREVEGLGGISDPQIWAQSPYHVGGHTPVPFGHPRHITTRPNGPNPVIGAVRPKWRPTLRRMTLYQPSCLLAIVQPALQHSGPLQSLDHSCRLRYAWHGPVCTGPSRRYSIDRFRIQAC